MALADFKQKAGAYLTTPPPNIPQAIAMSNTQEEQDGFFKSMGKAIIKPAQEFGKDLAEYTDDVRSARQSIDNLRKFDPAEADKIEAILGTKPSTEKIIGDFAGTVMTAIPLPIAKLGMVAKIGSPFLRAAVTGGGYMAAFSAADAMSQNKEAEDVAKAAGLGFLAGAPFGAASYLGVKGFVRLASLKPVQAAYNKIAEAETTKIITQYIRPVSSVLSKDFGDVGRSVSDRLINADRNVQGAMGRIMSIMDDVGAVFGKDDLGRETSYQLGKTLRGFVGEAAPKIEASKFTVAASTFRNAESENLSQEVFALTQEGKITEAAQKTVQVVDDELNAGLKTLGLKTKEIVPTIGVYEGGKEPSFLSTHFGKLDDNAMAEIAGFGTKTNQDSMLVYQTKIGSQLVTKADAQATPALRMKIPGLNAENIDEFRAALSEATGGKLGGYLTGNLEKGEIVLLNVQEFDGLTRQEFESLASEVRKVVQLNQGKVQTFYTRNQILTKENYGNYIQKAIGGESRGAQAAGGKLPARGRITGRVSERDGRIQSGEFEQEAFFGKPLPEDLKSLTPENFYRSLFGDVASEAQSRGTMIRVPAQKGEPAHWVKFEPLENYFPKQVSELTEMEVGGRLRKWVLRRAVEEGDFKTEAEAIKALDGYIEFVKKEGIGVSKQNGWIDYMVKSGQAETPGEAKRLMMRIFKEQSLVKLGGSLEHARIVNNPFYNPFPDEVAPLYAIDSITRLENINQFGVKYTGESAKLPDITKAIEDITKEKGRKVGERFNKFLDVAMNRINNATEEAKFVYYMRMAQVPKLSFAQIINIGQSVLNPLLETDARSTFMGLYKAFTNEGVSKAMESGATIQSVFNEMVRATAAGGNFADKFLKVTGFIWTEKFNRTVAANVGIDWAERNAEKFLANPTSAVYRARLEELGLNAEKILTRGKVTENELLKAAQVLAEKTQFRSRPLDLPIWASSNAGKLFWQFKNFTYNQFIFVFRDNLIKELRSGNYGRAARNLLILGTIFPMAGEVLQDVRSLVTQSRRPTGAFERYLSDISSVGSMALVSDLIDAIRFDRTDEFVLPPSFSSITNILNRADEPEEMIKEIIKQTGVGTPITNILRERRKGRASTLESIQDLLNQ